MRFFKKWQLQQELPAVRSFITAANLQRIQIVSVLLLLFEVIGIFDAGFWKSPFYVYGFIFLMILGLVFFVYTTYLRVRDLLQPVKKNTIVSMIFWLLFCVGMFPYYLGDLSTTGIPLNMTLVCAALIAIPIFTLEQAVCVYSLFTLLNLGLAIYLEKPFSLLLFILAVGLGGFIISHMIQSQYISIINQLKQENGMDFLTGILNRKGGFEKMEMLLAMCKRHRQMLAVCMIDIDFFKQYNDEFGHLQGDAALQRVSRCLASCCSRTTDVVCRYGGEEFLVCFTTHDKSVFEKQAERLRQAVEALHIPGATGQKYVTVSIGVSSYLPRRDSINTSALALIQQSDQALYQAKQNGRNQIVLYAPSVN